MRIAHGIMLSVLTLGWGLNGDPVWAQGAPSSVPMPLLNVGPSFAPAAPPTSPFVGKLTLKKPDDAQTHHCTASFVGDDVLRSQAAALRSRLPTTASAFQEDGKIIQRSSTGSGMIMPS